MNASAACCRLILVNISIRGKSTFLLSLALNSTTQPIQLFWAVGCGDAAVHLFLPFFYALTREPLCVNLQSKNVARDVERLVQGTSLKVTNKGCCWWVQFYCSLYSWWKAVVNRWLLIALLSNPVDSVKWSHWVTDGAIAIHCISRWTSSSCGACLYSFDTL